MYLWRICALYSAHHALLHTYITVGTLADHSTGTQSRRVRALRVQFLVEPYILEYIHNLRTLHTYLLNGALTLPYLLYIHRQLPGPCRPYCKPFLPRYSLTGGEL